MSDSSVLDSNRKLYRVLHMPITWPFLLCLILLMVILLYLFYPKIENFFLFFPESTFDLTPNDLRLNYKDVYFNTEDGNTLHGWFFPLEGESPVILFFHGNAGNISHRVDNIMLLLEQKLQVFIFDYRGFGKSPGRPSERGLYLDGLAAYDYLHQKEHIPSSDIILFGRSLGAAVAIEVALKKDVRSLIIESAFTSVKGMAKTLFLFNLLSPFLPAHYDNLTKIPRVTVPKLVIHGEADEIVPFSMGQKLFKASKDPKFFSSLKGAGHNDTYLVEGKQYFLTIAAFAAESKI